MKNVRGYGELAQDKAMHRLCLYMSLAILPAFYQYKGMIQIVTMTTVAILTAINELLLLFQEDSCIFTLQVSSIDVTCTLLIKNCLTFQYTFFYI